jgi:galactokinase
MITTTRDYEEHLMSDLRTNDPPLRLLMTFHQAFAGTQPHYVLQTPGREMWVAASIDRNDFTIHAPDLGARTTFSRQSAKHKRTVLNRPLPRWARYPAGVILQLGLDGLDVQGINAVVMGHETDVRYEYALGVTFAALLYNIYQQPMEHNTLIDVVERARRDYIGR